MRLFTIPENIPNKKVGVVVSHIVTSYRMWSKALIDTVSSTKFLSMLDLNESLSASFTAWPQNRAYEE